MKQDIEIADKQGLVYGRNSLQKKRKEHITSVLSQAAYDLDAAARILGLTVPKLRRWLQRLEIERCNGVHNLDSEDQ